MDAVGINCFFLFRLFQLRRFRVFNFIFARKIFLFFLVRNLDNFIFEREVVDKEIIFFFNFYHLIMIQTKQKLQGLHLFTIIVIFQDNLLCSINHGIGIGLGVLKNLLRFLSIYFFFKRLIFLFFFHFWKIVRIIGILRRVMVWWNSWGPDWHKRVEW